MITDTKEIAERLRAEADYWHDYNENDTLFRLVALRFCRECAYGF